MGRITVMNHVTLDGVMQSPGRADEDRRDGFRHGGWAVAGSDGVVGQILGERMACSGGWIFGRRTYEEVLSYWNRQPDSPFTPMLNGAPKYVASTELTEPLPWPNSTLIRGDVPEAVGVLKARSEEGLGIMGSGVLIHALLLHELIDEFLLITHPVVLGSGRRLFPEGSPLTTLRLVDTVRAPSGVTISTYERDESPPTDAAQSGNSSDQSGSAASDT